MTQAASNTVLAEVTDETKAILAALQQQLDEAHREIGSLLIANRRMERALNTIAVRLSRYEDVNTGELTSTAAEREQT